MLPERPATGERSACVLETTDERCGTPASFLAVCHSCGAEMFVCVYDAMLAQVGTLLLGHSGCDSTKVELELITTDD